MSRSIDHKRLPHPGKRQSSICFKTTRSTFLTALVGISSSTMIFSGAL
jgi:hypothetical protein